MAKGYFITGTDTGVGKTSITAALAAGMVEQGLMVAALKPVATGCVATPAGLRNADAEFLQKYANVELDYDMINPYAFEPKISPNLAATQAGQRIDLARIGDIVEQVGTLANCVLVEGVGGWQVPLTRNATVADLAKSLGFPVILVVSVRLGCLNHAILSAQSIISSGCRLAGWVANIRERNVVNAPEIIETLGTWIPAPVLGIVPPFRRFDVVAMAGLLDVGVLK